MTMLVKVWKEQVEEGRKAGNAQSWNNMRMLLHACVRGVKCPEWQEARAARVQGVPGKVAWGLRGVAVGHAVWVVKQNRYPEMLIYPCLLLCPSYLFMVRDRLN